MQLSRKQVILISVVSGVVLLVTVAAACLLPIGAGDTPAEPTAFPLETASLSPSPTAVPTPTPTAFRLPLVPQWDTPRPTAESTGAFGAFVPRAFAPPDGISPTGTAGAWVGAYDEHTKDILAVGLQNGRAAVLLLTQLDGGGLRAAALPADVPVKDGRPLEAVALSGDVLEERGAHAAALVTEATGMSYGAWLALDLSCLPAVLEITGPLDDLGAKTLAGNGRQRAQGALSLLTASVSYLQRASLLQLPALKRAVGEGFASSLSTWELWSLFWTVRRGIAVRGLLLSSDGRQADLSALRNFFGESS